MIIGIDIDDTLTILQKIKIETANNYIQKNNLPYKLIDENANFFSKMYDWPIDVCDKFWFLEADHMLDVATPREHASEVITKLKNMGHKIVIITARNNDWHKAPYEMSVNWLNRNNIPYDKLIIGFTDKIPVCQEEKIDIFIDDMPHTLIRLNDVGIDTIMMNTVSNKDEIEYKGKKAYSWLDVDKYIETKLNSEKKL